MFMNTAALDNHPIFVKLRMIPEIMPIASTTAIIPEKQTVLLDIWLMLVVLLKINTATVRNCWRHCATFMK